LTRRPTPPGSRQRAYEGQSGGTTWRRPSTEWSGKGAEQHEQNKTANLSGNALLSFAPTHAILKVTATAGALNADGTIKNDLFTPDNIHLSPAGYAVYAAKLKPLLK
jgi:lysophospholipase L1-like esterase